MFAYIASESVTRLSDATESHVVTERNSTGINF